MSESITDQVATNVGDCPERQTASRAQFSVPDSSHLGTYSRAEDLYSKFTLRDTGPDVQSRFRYQAALVALFAIRALLGDDNNYVAVYCEILEDFLIEHKLLGYTAVQVKTREIDLERFKTGDKEILSSIARFNLYECEEGRQFFRYIIASNAGFWKDDKTWQNLEHVRAVAADAVPPWDNAVSTLLNNIATRLESIPANELAVVARVFKKLELNNSLPRLRYENHALRDALTEHLKDLRVRDAEYVVNDLVQFVISCSDRSGEDKDGIMNVLSIRPEEADAKMRVNSRRITRESLSARIVSSRKIAERMELARNAAFQSDTSEEERDKRGSVFNDCQLKLGLTPGMSAGELASYKLPEKPMLVNMGQQNRNEIMPDGFVKMDIGGTMLAKPVGECFTPAATSGGALNE